MISDTAYGHGLSWWIWVIPVPHARSGHRPARRPTIEVTVRLRCSISHLAGPGGHDPETVK
jgi:hypothetical protein